MTSGYSRAMESIDLEMGDIFDDEAVTVGDGELPPPLPEMDTEDAAPGDGDRAEGDATGQPSSHKPLKPNPHTNPGVFVQLHPTGLLSTLNDLIYVL